MIYNEYTHRPYSLSNMLFLGGRVGCFQTPVVRAKAYDTFALDTYPTGTNAIVAVISYTV